jgi:hypothetical protein
MARAFLRAAVGDQLVESPREHLQRLRIGGGRRRA